MTANNKQSSSLREDIRLLGNLLGNTVKEQVGAEFFEKIEQVRKLSKAARRENCPDVKSELKAVIKNLSNEEIKNLTRSFGFFMNLANISENYHTMRDLQQYDDGALTKHFTQLTEIIPRLIKCGIDADEVLNTVADMNIELVLTAHPTEVKRRTQLQKHGKITKLLGELDQMTLTTAERRECRESLQTIISTLWASDEIRRVKPTPIEEARWGMAMIEDVLWDAIPAFMRELDTIVENYTGKTLPAFIAPVNFASWMGGDRDGNPNVTSKVTENVILMNRWTAAQLYHNEINAVIQNVSCIDCNDELREVVGEVQEPYRTYLRPFRTRLFETRRWLEAALDGRSYEPAAEIIEDASELKEAFELCYNSVKECYGKKLADNYFLDSIRRVACFGMTLTKLDIRQESTRHLEAVNAITEYVGLGSYAEWSEEEKQAFLVKELQSPRPLLSDKMPMSDEVREVIETCKVLARESYESFGAYVISMAQAPSDVLAVHLLQKECGVEKPLRVVPLFETLDDLQNSGEIMDTLFSTPWYKEVTGGSQEVMIGYSDSGKDAGKLAASWAQYEAQEQLHAISIKHGIKLTLFHGRGGSIGRGGGPVEHALLSQPPGTVEGRMRVTEQGEVITQKFSTMDVAQHNLKLYIAAVLEATLAPPPAPKQEWRDIMAEMSVISCEAYRDIVRGRENFVKYFRQVTPEQELGRLCIGSRPAKRKKSGGIESLRAIPWVFAWTQMRLLMPAWLGIGEGIGKALADGKKELLQEMIQDWPFFYFLMDMVDMVLEKTDAHVAAYYDDLLASDDVKPLGVEIREKLKTTKETAQEVVSGLNISEEREKLRASVRVRNPYADTLNYLQGEIMRRMYKENQEGDVVLEDALMATIAGISAAMKNTG